MRARALSSVTLMAGAIVVAGVALPVPAGDDSADNLRLTITIEESGAGRSEPATYELLVADGATARLKCGWRLPVPRPHDRSEDGEQQTARSFYHYNVGVSAAMGAAVQGDGGIRVEGSIEVDTYDPEVRDTRKLNQHFTVVLADGRGRKIAEVPRPGGGKWAVRMQAEIIR